MILYSNKTVHITILKEETKGFLSSETSSKVFLRPNEDKFRLLVYTQVSSQCNSMPELYVLGCTYLQLDLGKIIGNFIILIKTRQKKILFLSIVLINIIHIVLII